MVNYAPPLFQRPLQNPTHRLLVLGDSQAAGVGTSSPELSISGLFAAAYPGWSVETIALSGAKIPAVTNMLTKASQPHYDLILLFAGANDLIWLSPQSSIRKNLPKLISAAKPMADNIAVSHGGNLGKAPAWPRLIAPYFTHRSRIARNTYIRLASKLDFIYLDSYDTPTSLKKYHAEDGLHLNDAGYADSFKLIRQTLSDHQVGL